MHNEEKGYGKISKDLQLPKSTVQSIIKKVKDSGNLENLSRSGRPAKVSTTGIRRIVREVNKNPVLPEMKLDRSWRILAPVSVVQLWPTFYTRQTWEAAVLEKLLYCVPCTWRLVSSIRMNTLLKNLLIGTVYCGQTRQNWNFSAIQVLSMFGGKRMQPSKQRIPSPQWSMAEDH